METFLFVLGLPTMLYIGYNVSRTAYERLDVDNADATASTYKVPQLDTKLELGPVTLAYNDSLVIIMIVTVLLWRCCARRR